MIITTEYARFCHPVNIIDDEAKMLAHFTSTENKDLAGLALRLTRKKDLQESDAYYLGTYMSESSKQWGEVFDFYLSDLEQ